MSADEYPRVILREINPDGCGDAIWVHLSAEPRDVVHLDAKPGEHLTDEEAVACAVFLRYRGQPEKMEAEFDRWVSRRAALP